MVGFQKVLLFFTVTILLFASCKKEENLIFEGAFETRFIIPSGLSTVLTHYITIPNVFTDFGRRAGNAGITAEDVKSIQASYGKMVTLFNNDDLDFIQDISIVVFSRNNPSVKREMYYSEFVPFTVNNEIKLQSGAAELAEILNEDYIDIEIRITIRSFVPNPVEAKLEMSYLVF